MNHASYDRRLKKNDCRHHEISDDTLHYQIAKISTQQIKDMKEREKSRPKKKNKKENIHQDNGAEIRRNKDLWRASWRTPRARKKEGWVPWLDSIKDAVIELHVAVAV